MHPYGPSLFARRCTPVTFTLTSLLVHADVAVVSVLPGIDWLVGVIISLTVPLKDYCRCYCDHDRCSK